MEMIIATHENYIYDELIDELVEIPRLRNESENDIFQRVMWIYCRFLEQDEPSGQEISNWFSYLISTYEECDLNDQAISYSQNSDMTTNDIGDIVSNQHSDTTMEKYLSVVLYPVAPECEQCNNPPYKTHDHILVYDESLTEEIPSSSKFEYLHAMYTYQFDDNHPHEKPFFYHVINSSHYYFVNEMLNDILDQEECPSLIN